MKRFLVAIAGGTGSGKSTLAYGLLDDFPEKVGIIHFDDYMKKREEVPRLHDMPNFDDPRAINWEQLVNDLQKLRRGGSVEVMTKSERFNPHFRKSGGTRIPHAIHPKQVLLVEGFLSLYSQEVRTLLNYSIYLDSPFAATLARRTKLMPDNEAYNELVLQPMHARYVEPSKAHAELVIDVTGKTVEQVREIVKTHLSAEKVL